MTALATLGEKVFPIEKIRQRLIRRVRQRRGPTQLPFQLEYRNIFILPTVFGFGFGFMLLAMALGGLNFSNNMALLLVFILAAIAQLTTVLAYRNLAGLRIENVLAEPVFCGEPAHFRVYLSNPEERPRPVLQGGFRAPQDCVDIDMQSGNHLVLKQATWRRGWLEMDSFHLATRYPLGMFRAWAWLFPVAKCLVYPAPAKNPPPLPRVGSGPEGRAMKGEGEQVHGLREYRRGDSPKRIAWRTSARHDELYTREMETPRDDACVISWNALPGIEGEQRLSILTSWVLMADHRQLAYSLETPDAILPAGQGLDQRNRCLELLALYRL